MLDSHEGIIGAQIPEQARLDVMTTPEAGPHQSSVRVDSSMMQLMTEIIVARQLAYPQQADSDYIPDPVVRLDNMRKMHDFEVQLGFSITEQTLQTFAKVVRAWDAAYDDEFGLDEMYIQKGRKSTLRQWKGLNDSLSRDGVELNEFNLTDEERIMRLMRKPNFLNRNKTHFALQKQKHRPDDSHGVAIEMTFHQSSEDMDQVMEGIQRVANMRRQGANQQALHPLPNAMVSDSSTSRIPITQQQTIRTPVTPLSVVKTTVTTVK